MNGSLGIAGPGRRGGIAAAALGTAVVLLVAALPLSRPAGAGPAQSTDGAATSPLVGAEPELVEVATGLANPRHVDVGPRGRLYVAEAGRGGDIRVDVTMGDGRGPICVGATGAITEVRGDQTRRFGGLPSWAGTDEEGQCPGDGGFALGPHGVAVSSGGWIAHTIGLGADPAVRPTVADGLEAASRFGTAQRLSANGNSHRLGDLAGFEAAANPVGEPDSNPYGMAAAGNGDHLVADAGGNSLVHVARHGGVSLVAVFPDAAPQQVPTGVAVGPDGDFYVSELRGVPFIPASSRVWRIDADRSEPAECGTATSLAADGCEVYASGLTSVVDIDFGDDGRLYAVQFADGGVLAPETGISDEGSVQVIPPGGGAPTQEIGGLTVPGGVAVDGDDVYITTGSVSPDDGRLVRTTTP